MPKTHVASSLVTLKGEGARRAGYVFALLWYRFQNPRIPVEEAEEFLRLAGVTPYSINKGLKWLFENRWIGRHNGLIFLRSKRDLRKFNDHDLAPMLSAREFLSSYQDFSDYLDGLAICATAVQLRPVDREARRACNPTFFRRMFYDTGKGSSADMRWSSYTRRSTRDVLSPSRNGMSEGPVSLEIISKKHGVSTSEASRMRKAAARAGVISLSQQFALLATGSVSDHLAFVENASVMGLNKNRIRFREDKGLTLYQMPSRVGFASKLYFSK